MLQESAKGSKYRLPKLLIWLDPFGGLGGEGAGEGGETGDTLTRPPVLDRLQRRPSGCPKSLILLGTRITGL